MNGFIIAIFIIIILLFLSFFVGLLVNLIVPFLTTPKKVTDEILQLLDLQSEDIFYDLGSGDGRLLFQARKQSDVTCVGFEINPLLLLYSNILKTIFFPFKNENIQILPKSIFQIDLNSSTKVYAYLNEESLKTLKKKIEEYTDRKGEFFSYKYPVEGLKEKSKVELSNGVYIWVYKK